MVQAADWTRLRDRTAAPPPSSDPSTPAWYACCTRARHEKRVHSMLAAAGLETYLPLVPLRRKWHDREKVVEFPMFPGYVFTRFQLEQLVRVLRVPGVARIVRGPRGTPAPISDLEIAGVRHFASFLATGGDTLELFPFEEGEEVMITSGPLSGVAGVVLERRNRRRVLIQVGLRAIGRGMRVLVESAALQPLSEPIAARGAPGASRPTAGEGVFALGAPAR